MAGGTTAQHDSDKVPPLIALFHPNPGGCAVLIAAIETAGYRCEVLPDPAGGLRRWREARFDLLVLNPFLGWQEPPAFIGFARALAASRPLLVLTHRDTLDERLTALNGGGDDATALSDDPAEIVARIGSLMRRSRIAAGQLACNELRIDLIDRRVERAGRAIRLPLREFDLLANLARNPDRAISRRTLLRAVWQIDFDPGTNRVAVHMSRLRAKIDRDFGWPMLKTVKGEGYALRSHRGASGPNA